MTLPFDIPDRNKRKYQCFVCGIMCQSFDTFKAHIIEKHDEGREYVLCPCQHCGAPVRDLRGHFKVKHPSLAMPKVPMAKAMIWRDFTPKGEKKKTHKPKFREGWYESSKMGKKFHYRSGYECTVYECLDADNEVDSFDVEPFEIPYIHEGHAKKYIPDIIVRFKDGRVELWEVKPAKQTLLEQNQDKWSAADLACKTRGWQFVVITETGIDKLKLKIRNQNSIST